MSGFLTSSWEFVGVWIPDEFVGVWIPDEFVGVWIPEMGPAYSGRMERTAGLSVTSQSPRSPQPRQLLSRHRIVGQ
jgi:hypothetical protein